MAGYIAHDFRTVGCEHCTAGRSHRHTDTEFRIASSSRRDCLHMLNLARYGQFCSCEGGQEYQRQRKYHDNATPCRHVEMALWMVENGVWVMPVSVESQFRAGHAPWRMESVAGGELFEEAIAASAPVGVGGKKSPHNLEDTYAA